MKGGCDRVLLRQRNTTLAGITALLMIGYGLILSPPLFAGAPTDDQLKALEQQIERQETEQAETRKRAAEDARLKAEEQASLEAEKKQREAEAEAARQQAETERINAEQQQAQVEKDKQDAFAKDMATADAALSDRDREAAIIAYEKALSVYPDNESAMHGLQAAKDLKEKVCYDVLGEWSWNNGEATLILKEDGSLQYNYWGNHSGQWSCSNPTARQIHVRITALGFTNEWDPVLSADNTCLGMKLALVGPECLYRPGNNQGKNSPANDQPVANPLYGQ